MTDKPAEVRTAAYRRHYRFGDIWVQQSPVSGKWRWRIPAFAAFRDWSFSHYSTWDDAFHNAETAVQRMPHMTQPDVLFNVLCDVESLT